MKLISRKIRKKAKNDFDFSIKIVRNFPWNQFHEIFSIGVAQDMVAMDMDVTVMAVQAALPIIIEH